MSGKEYLDTNRLNYLVWRYLIEGNYHETAVKFQKEWHLEAPHRQLDFAPHVKSHALVGVVNKGLSYVALEREVGQSQLPQDAAASEAMPMGLFGPLAAHQQQPLPLPGKAVEDHDPEEDAEGELDISLPDTATIENIRKRPHDDLPRQPQLHGLHAKRPRLSNGGGGYEEGAPTAAMTTIPMEINGQDGQVHPPVVNHAYPSPLEVEGEQAPTPVPRTDGPEQGTQVEKVEELATDTTFIPLGSEDAAVASPLTTMSRINSETAPVVLHCQWNPRDPTILAAAGTDALARIWTVSRAVANTDPSLGHVNGIVPPFHSLIEDDIAPKSTVTSMAWNQDGTAIAIATDSESKARISLWSVDGSHINHFEVPESPIIKIRWSPNNDAILGIAPDSGGALATVYIASTMNSQSYVVPHHDLDTEPLDAAWTSETELILCGGEMLVALMCTGEAILETRKFEMRHGDSLTQVRFDSRCGLVATCGEKGFVDVWDAGARRREIRAHDGAVTTLAWQPLQSPAAPDERLLASGGIDGSTSIWNVFSSDGKPKCSMKMGHPIVALAFTPDGAFLAGATSEKILIWKVGEHSMPRASWNRTPHPGWLSPRLDSDSDEEDEHCLCWDSTGQKLAYGVNSRLAVIHFR